MFIKLCRAERYRGQEHQKGAVIEVGDALGYSMILNGHKRSNSEAFEIQRIGIDLLSADEIDMLSYQELKSLIARYEIEHDGKSTDVYKAALKSFFDANRG